MIKYLDFSLFGGRGQCSLNESSLKRKDLLFYLYSLRGNDSGNLKTFPKIIHGGIGRKINLSSIVLHPNLVLISQQSFEEK